MPECAARPWKRTCIAREYGAPRITSPIGAAWSYTYPSRACRRSRSKAAGAEEAHFLLRREQELDAAVRSVLGKDPASAFEHRRDGRLVVRAEDRAGRVAHDAVLDHRLDRALGRNRVEMCAQEDGVAAVRRFQAAVDVADVRADLRARVVLVHRQAEIAQVADHDVGNRALLARRARERRQLGEKVDDLGGHRSILCRTTRRRLRRRRTAHASARVRHRRSRGTAAPAASAAT